jgi:hypothetical protein
MISKLLISLMLVCGTARAVTPEEGQQAADHYNMLWHYDMNATYAVYNKFGKQLRIATLLKECKLEALADTVAPTEDQIDNLIIQYLENQPDGKSVFWEVRAAVQSALFYYQAGFQESAAALRAGGGDKFCQDITRQANEILRERKGEK